MSSLELAVATLRSLPEAFQGQAWSSSTSSMRHAATRQERLEALRKTAGSPTDEEADAMEHAIAQSFEHVDSQ